MFFSFVGALYDPRFWGYGIHVALYLANMADQSISMGIKKDPIDGGTLVPYKGICSRDIPLFFGLKNRPYTW